MFDLYTKDGQYRGSLADKNVAIKLAKIHNYDIIERSKEDKEMVLEFSKKENEV